MTVGELSAAQDLVSDLSEYMNTERQLLEELKESLEKYQQFLMESIKENREPN